MENKRGMSPILIVVLSVIGTCLVILGVWYGINYFKGEEKPNNIDDNPSVINPESSNNLVESETDFPQKSDDSVVVGRFYEFLGESELKTNFKNLKKEKNGNTFVYNCESYSNSDSVCEKVKLTINNELSIEKTVPFEVCGINEGCLLEVIIYKVNSYYVVYSKGGGGLDDNDLTIYKDSNIIYKKVVKSLYWLDENYASRTTFYVKPAIVNNTLHFVEQSGYSGSMMKAKYNTIDLSKDKIEVKLVKEFNAYFSGEK